LKLSDAKIAGIIGHCYFLGVGAVTLNHHSGIGDSSAAGIRNGAANGAVGGGLGECAASEYQANYQGEAKSHDGELFPTRTHIRFFLSLIADTSRTCART